MFSGQSGRWIRVTLPLIVTLPLGACTGSPQRAESDGAGPEAQAVDLSGEWVLNEQLSDSPREVLSAETSGNGSSVAARRIGGSVGVFGVSVNEVIGMLPRRDRETDELNYHSHVTDARGTLKVEQSTNSVQVTYDQAGTAFYVNGKTTHDQLDEIFSDWNENTYVVTREPDDGPVLTEIFQLGPDGSQLIWTVTFETNGKEIVITRVYDAADTEERTS